MIPPGWKKKTNAENPGGIAGWVGGAGELIGQMGYTLPRSLDEAAMAGAIGTVVGAAAGPVSVATALGGFGVGMKAGMSKEMFKIEAGSAYKEMIDNGIDEETARDIALGVGGVNAALEFVQLGTLSKAYKILKNSGNAVTKKAANSLLKNLAKMGINITEQTGQEITQEGVTITGAQVANKMEKGDWGL